MGMVSIGVYGIMLGGWASNNKFALMGAIRASSQMISYELAMGLALLAIILMNGSLDLKEIAANQSDFYGLGWNIFFQPIAFLVFFVAALAETNRAPFDLPECETELVGGFHTEYSSMKLGLFLFGEYVNMFISSALITTLFLEVTISWISLDW
jgi:NADH-quinone oxidoreductase subunit H